MKNIPTKGTRRQLLIAIGVDTPGCGGKRNPCNVMLVAKDGSASVYQKHEGSNL